MPQSSGSFKPPLVLLGNKNRSDTEAAATSSDGAGESSTSPPSLRPFCPGNRGHSGRGVRRRNPFARTDSPDRARKKARTAADGDAGFEPSWGSADTAVKDRRLPAPPPPPDQLFADANYPALKSPVCVPPPLHDDYPTDWSVKTRLVVTSALTLGWAQQPRVQEEAQALVQHCRAQFTPLPLSPQYSSHPSIPPPQDVGGASQLRSSFLQALVYWQHPALPWLRLFPRINADRSFSGHSAPWVSDAALQQTLMREWVVSLSSLYGLLKSRLCPYFYLCSSQFTVLFRAAGVGGYGNITAFLSPTTRGLRQALKAEGISFSVPLMEDKPRMEQHTHQDSSSSIISSATASPACDEAAPEGDEDSTLSWLKEMGVQDKISDGLSLQLHRDSHMVCVDHKPESLVCVEGAHTFTLINFLINWKGVVAAAGPQAGLPPTLLAPTAFRGATVHTLKSRCVNVKSQVGSSFQNISSLEITGPVLPSALHSITSLLQWAQRGSFSAALVNHSPTAVMNVHNPGLQVCVGPVELSSCGVDPGSLQQLQLPSPLGSRALTHIDMEQHSYSWRS